tara:strand:+ start:927 stop:1166 length:240 start_codon:yes stop_codon:yes gene_type:complete
MKKVSDQKHPPFLFTKTNYIILLVSLLLLAIGFVCMMGGGGENDFDFNPDIFSPQRIVFAPIIIIAGYIGMIFAIFYND